MTADEPTTCPTCQTPSTDPHRRHGPLIPCPDPWHDEPTPSEAPKCCCEEHSTGYPLQFSAAPVGHGTKWCPSCPIHGIQRKG